MSDDIQTRPTADELESKLLNIDNLVIALGYFVHDFGGQPVERGTELYRIRQAIIGITDALEREVVLQ